MTLTVFYRLIHMSITNTIVRLVCAFIKFIRLVPLRMHYRSIRKNMIRRILKVGSGVVILILIVSTHGFSQHYLQREDAWVNATISNMTLDEKVGQLFMVRAFSKGYAGEEKKNI